MVEKIKNGCWYSEAGKFYWKEYLDTYGNKYKLYNPSEIEGVSRSCEFRLAFAREVNDENSFSSKKKLWFMQTVKLTVRPDVTGNIWLIWNDVNRKWFLRDLSELGMMLVCPLENSEIILCEKTEPARCSQAEVQELLKTSGYIYSMVTTDAKGEIEDYVVTV
jgi:hypothetical protein